MEIDVDASQLDVSHFDGCDAWCSLMFAAKDIAELRRAVADLDGQIVAIGGHRASRLVSLVHHLAFGKEVPDSALLAAIGPKSLERASRNPMRLPSAGGKSIAILTAHGITTQKLELQPFAFSTALLAQNVTALAHDCSIDAIIIDLDTAGGHVVGTPEAADAIARAATRKPVIAFVDALAASAGFWLASRATRIVAATSAQLGSIGCFMLHVDFSQAMASEGIKPTFIVSKQSPHKTELNPYEPLTPEAKAFENQQVNRIAAMFIRDVAAGRGVTPSVVEERFGGGRVLMAPDALKVGMIDQIGGMDAAIGAGRTRPSADALRRSRRLALLIAGGT